MRASADGSRRARGRRAAGSAGCSRRARPGRSCRMKQGVVMKRFAAIVFLLIVYAAAGHAEWVSGNLNASLDNGSLAGTRFWVTFSYDLAQILAAGDSWIPLSSFDFALFGVPFTRHDVFQGGQVIFRNGRLDNVTASFQVILPEKSPVKNITFGFGGPGVIGYIDLDGQFGSGSFTEMRVHPGRIVHMRSVASSSVLEGKPAIEMS